MASYNDGMNSEKHFDLVACALNWIVENQVYQPRLDVIAGEIGTSPYHLQRVFQAWAGVSPKQFLKFLTREAALERLADGETVLEAALASGLSGPGRLHDLLITTDALTPGEARRRGAGVELAYGFGSTPFGDALVAWNSRGISFLGFCFCLGRERALEELRSRWPDAALSIDDKEAEKRLFSIFQRAGSEPMGVWLRGSPFQLKVWEALLAIPEGSFASYGDIAKMAGCPGAARAVGSAVGSNPVAWLIPCHRVIRSVGELGGYRWGPATKYAMAGFEAVRTRFN